MLHGFTVTTDAQGDGWMETTLPWSTFQAVSKQGGYPPSDGYWPGEVAVQDRANNILIQVTGARANSTAGVFVLATA
jgi:hypothetical protein